MRGRSLGLQGEPHPPSHAACSTKIVCSIHAVSRTPSACGASRELHAACRSSLMATGRVGGTEFASHVVWAAHMLPWRPTGAAGRRPHKPKTLQAIGDLAVRAAGLRHHTCNPIWPQHPKYAVRHVVGCTARALGVIPQVSTIKAQVASTWLDCRGCVPEPYTRVVAARDAFSANCAPVLGTVPIEALVLLLLRESTPRHCVRCGIGGWHTHWVVDGEHPGRLCLFDRLPIQIDGDVNCRERRRAVAVLGPETLIGAFTHKGATPARLHSLWR